MLPTAWSYFYWASLSSFYKGPEKTTTAAAWCIKIGLSTLLPKGLRPPFLALYVSNDLGKNIYIHIYNLEDSFFLIMIHLEKCIRDTDHKSAKKKINFGYLLLCSICTFIVLTFFMCKWSDFPKNINKVCLEVFTSPSTFSTTRWHNGN